MYVAVNNASTFQGNLFAAFLDSPSTTSETTYKIQGNTESGNTLTINRSATDSDSATHYRSASSITAIEVSA